MNQIKIYYPSIIWTLIILALTLTPGSNVPKISIEGLDKIIHFFLFGILAFLIQYGNKKQHSKQWVLSFFIPFIIGIAIEFLQKYVPGRSFSAMDIIANTLGITTGIILFLLLKKKRS